MYIINNKAVVETKKGYLMIDDKAYKSVSVNEYITVFGEDINRADLERIYIFKVLQEDKLMKKASELVTRTLKQLQIQTK